MKNISHLPSYLLDDIVSRLPLKSMRAVRLTCKTFYTLCKSPRFTKLHHDKEAAATREGESRMIVLRDYSLYLISVVINGDPYIESKSKLTFLHDSEQVKISKFFHCEGLVLCILKDDARVVVWNPYLGQTNWIKPIYSDSPLEVTRSYALGYVNKKSCRSHKVLMVKDDWFFPHGKHCYEIYDFDSDSWITLDFPPNLRIPLGSHGVSLKGNTYWSTSAKNSSNEDHIICFDFTRERFGSFLRLPFCYGCEDNVTLSCVKEEKLAALHKNSNMYSYKFNIWITTKIKDEEISWSKFLTVDTRIGMSITCESFFIEEEKKVVMGFDTMDHDIIYIIGEAKYFERVKLGVRAGKNCRPDVCGYVLSLVQIKQPIEGHGENKAT